MCESHNDALKLCPTITASRLTFLFPPDHASPKLCNDSPLLPNSLPDRLTQADLMEHQDNPLKVQLIGLLQAVTYLKLPLIVLNILVILIELVVG